jgi:hypothetical protein
LRVDVPLGRAQDGELTTDGLQQVPADGTVVRIEPTKLPTSSRRFGISLMSWASGQHFTGIQSSNDGTGRGAVGCGCGTRVRLA